MCGNVLTGIGFVPNLVPRSRNAVGVSTTSLRQLQMQEAIMSLFAWIVLGLIAGFISSNFVDAPGQGVTMDVILGSALLLVAYYAVSRNSRSE
jgi:hypothetical protein